MSENVLLVTVDSLRADHVLGAAADTPVLDDLAAGGLSYQRAFAQGPFTTFSMPSLFTSRYPSGLNYLEFSESTVGSYIDEEPTLQSVLQKAGYQTAGFHSNPLLSNLFGFDRGFDTFDARLPFSNTDMLPGRAKILADKVFRTVRKHPYLPARKLNERAIEWLDGRDPDQPFFLWVHYMDVHGPYIAKSGNHYLNKYRGERLWRKAVTSPEEITDDERDRLCELYREEVAYTDSQLGNLLDALRNRDLWNDTMVAVTSDHGEAFGEHGAFSHPHQLYDELTHVPLIVRTPNGPTGTVDATVELLDLAPTLVERATGDVPNAFAGNRLPAPDQSINEEDRAISEADVTPNYTGSVRTSEYRYIRDDGANREELYDVTEDPDQERNVADDRPDVRGRLADMIEEHLASERRDVGPDRDVARAGINDEGVQDRLRDLGYME